MRYLLIIISAFFFLQACKVPQKAVGDIQLDVPEAYQVEGEGIETIAVAPWQSFFEDDHLKALIDTALVYNQDLRKTLENIRISQARLKAARLGRLPEVNAMAGASVRRFGDYTMDGIGNTDTNFSEFLPADKRLPSPYPDFIIGAEFGWELDIWGRLSGQKRAAAARYMASEEMLRNVQTWLVAEVAHQYYEMLGLDEEIAVLEKNIELQELAFELSKDLKNSGKENQLAVDQFEAQMLNSKSLLIHKKRELRTVELNISELSGKYPEQIERVGLDPAFAKPRAISLGLPADLLRLRPDVRRAEQELAASQADVNVARADFFPSLQLFGMAGFNAFDFSKLFLNPASSVYQLGAGLSAPIFNRRRIRSAYEEATASQKLAWLDYEQTVLKSYLEVLDMVNVYSTLEEQLTVKKQEVNVQKRSVENSNTMFSVGYANYLEVINSQSRALNAELEYIELKREQLQAIASMYRSLGGGWN
ncbi:TolC family protein [Litoribacter ruber]|uniref:TolC family protein n=1 Tax=Litoribacter ruber TaxID=702568 RepID=UPI001BDACDC8|nr:TolC family protein [Litoribacter ruber]MBT0811513.1 TolC family protein [Litoribacter ruber]